MKDKLKELEQMLKEHDWFYDMSESHSRWLRGGKQWDDINALIKQLRALGQGSEADKLFNQYKKELKT